MSTEQPGDVPVTFTVVIPTYNRLSMVVQAVESVLAQTCPADEIIVVDDGSVDGTADELRSRFAGSPLTVIAGQHRGASAARNAGVEQASGEYIAFLDSDDLFHPDKLHRFRAAIRDNPGAVLFHSHWNELNLKTGVSRVVATELSGDARHALLMFGRIATPTVVARRDHILRAGGFDESIFLVEDYDLWCRLSSLGPVALIPEALTTVRIHEHNSPRDPETILTNQLKVIDRYFDTCRVDGLGPRKSYVANALYWDAYLFFTAGCYSRAMTLFSKAWAYDWKHNRSRCAFMIGRAIKALLTRQLNSLLGRWRSPGATSS